MNVQKLTQKSIEAVQAAQQYAIEHGQSEVRQAHLLHGLLTEQDGLIPSMLQGMDVDVKSLRAACDVILEKLPRMSGGSGEAYLSRDLDAAFRSAEATADRMEDEYVSVEHLFLGLLDKADHEMQELFRTYGITKPRFLERLKAVRGNRKVQ